MEGFGKDPTWSPAIFDDIPLGHSSESSKVIDVMREIDTRVAPLLSELQDQRAPQSRLMLDLAFTRDEARIPLSVTPESLFGRHVAVLGTTGGGKSWTLARIVEQAARFGSKTILFDASGEFYSMEGPVAHVYIGRHPDPPAYSTEAAIPYYQLKESDLFAIFQPSGQAQGPKLRAAMKTLKLMRLAPNLAVDGTFVKANKSKVTYEREYLKHVSALERPDCNFDVNHLIKQVQNECVNPFRSAAEPYTWGDINGLEQSLCVPLLNRMQDIIHSPDLAPIFRPGKRESLMEVIANFLDDPGLRVLVVSLEYLSFAHGAREIIANATGRYLMDLARNGRFRECPLLVILDEAHQYLNSMLENANRDLSLDSFGMIAKEGRKYSLSICLATQRPRDIPESVLSQMGTFIIHRLINDRDLSVVERAAGAANRNVMDAVPVLGSGEAVIIGADFTEPLEVRIAAPDFPPNSRGPDYQRFWR